MLAEYEAALDAWAGEQRALAEAARRAGDEREKSLCLMRAGMLGDMLKVMGRVEHEGLRSGIMQAQAEVFGKEASRQRWLGDYDQAERAEIKADTVLRALTLLRELEGEV